MSPDSPLIAGGVIAYCLLWSFAYILIIRRGFLDKTYGVPCACICINVSWEFLFSFVYPDSNMVRTWLYRFWLIPDIIILFQLFKYGKNAQIIPEIKKYFYPVLILSFVLSFVTVWTFVVYYHDYTGTEVSLFMNTAMSILFVLFYLSRRSLAGQSILIAWTKMIATFIAFIIVHLAYPSVRPDKPPFSIFEVLGIITFLADMTYIILLHNAPPAIKKSHIW